MPPPNYEHYRKQNEKNLLHGWNEGFSLEVQESTKMNTWRSLESKNSHVGLNNKAGNVPTGFRTEYFCVHVDCNVKVEKKWHLVSEKHHIILITETNFKKIVSLNKYITIQKC